MALIYITGIPGTGKSTIRKELLRRGYKALGGAEDNLAAFYDNETSERIDGWIPADKRTPEWLNSHTWKISRRDLEQLCVSAKNETVYICAVTANDIEELWDLFDKVFALHIDEETLRQRLAERTNNDVGKVSHELEAILSRQKSARQLYESHGAVIIDATKPVNEVVDTIIRETNK